MPEPNLSAGGLKTVVKVAGHEAISSLSGGLVFKDGAGRAYLLDRGGRGIAPRPALREVADRVVPLSGRVAASCDYWCYAWRQDGIAVRQPCAPSIREWTPGDLNCLSFHLMRS